LPQAAKAAGVLSLGKVLELREAGVDVAGLMNEDGRQQLYRDEVRLGGSIDMPPLQVHGLCLRTSQHGHRLGTRAVEQSRCCPCA
jgi:hypothetical protein